MIDRNLSDWLLDSDPALRWQVERDLLGLPEQIWMATRSRVALEGFGARLLELQDPDGQWAGGAFFPADFKWESMQIEGQPWTATTWTLKTLREWGVDATVLGDTAERLAANSRWEYEDLPYWGGEVDCCGPESWPGGMQPRSRALLRTDLSAFPQVTRILSGTVPAPGRQP